MIVPGAALAALLGAVTMPQVPAPPTADLRVRGQIINGRTLAPVKDALVSVAEAGRGVRTNETGRFELTGLAPGDYTLTVSTVGYIFVRRSIAVVTGASGDLVIPLAEGTGTYEESVRVTASPEDRKATSTTLTSAALQDLRDIAADDPVRAVQALPGAATGDDFRAEFSIRGSAFRHVGIVIDGTATPLLFHTMGGIEDPGSIAMINTDVLTRAALDIGIHPQIHGDWLGATLSFDIREGSRDRRTMRLAVSGTNAATVVEGPVGRARRGSWLVSVRKSYVDWLIRRVAPRIDSTIGFVDTQAKLAYDLTSRQHVELLFIGGRATYDKSAATGNNEVDLAHSNTALASVAWRYARSRYALTQRLSVVDNHFRATGSVGQPLSIGTAGSVIWRGDATTTGRDWQFDAGARYERQTFSRTVRNFTTVSGGTLRVRAENALDAVRSISGSYIQIGRRRNAGALTAGVRASSDSETRASRAAPWLLAERQAGPVRLFGGLGLAHQYPAFDALSEAETALRPEDSWGLDAGVGGSIGATSRWRVTGYRRRESNMQRQTNDDRLVDGRRVTAPIFETVASDVTGLARGIELVLERNAATGPSGWLGYAWAHLVDRDTRTGEVFDGDFDQRHTLNMFVQQRLSYRMKVTAKLRVGSNFPIVGYLAGTPAALVLSETRNAVRLPMYSRLDLSGSRAFTFARRRLTVFAEFLNVLNRRNFGPGNGSIRSNLSATGYTERLLPFIPSAGLLLEF